ncbi:hypothetical protein BK730_30735 [Bacillus wiedmannii]|uniref:Uncharacterized protein n=1 Tax=Bacillus wiedmannii TaxID=1890302 RepID=A0A242YX32_9BACI|nr:hypothetical protein [Bacillus wiedmannii]OTX84295.1 hypothetical protein BK730_30735 [Bacillus wiedmannii]OUB38375.1 hypothetical protein BK740_27240 [Bacillus thuringiensis serovar argentinensis]
MLKVEEIKSGKKFEQGIDYTNIIEGYPIIMKYFIEIDREVLRVLLHDGRGIIPISSSCYKEERSKYYCE